MKGDADQPEQGKIRQVVAPGQLELPAREHGDPQQGQPHAKAQPDQRIRRQVAQRHLSGNERRPPQEYCEGRLDVRNEPRAVHSPEYIRQPANGGLEFVVTIL